jgi:outer membrane protein assembly factor BamB
MISKSVVFIGIKGTVLALDRAAGQEIWRSKLEGYDFVNVAIQDGDLYASTHGELYCLDPLTGAIRWKNELKGLGFGMVAIATATAAQSVLIRARQQGDEAAAAAANATVV